MKRYCFGVMVLLVVALPVVAADLITNGNFEQDLSIGWEQDEKIHYNVSKCEISSDDYNSDGDKEAYTYTYLGYHATLYQTVSMQSQDVLFSASAKLYPSKGVGGYWAVSAIRIYYLDSSENTLGETRIYATSGTCPWSNSSTVHLIKVSDTGWHDYSFNIQDELANLSGVNPSNIAKLKVALYCYVDKACAG